MNLRIGFLAFTILIGITAIAQKDENSYLIKYKQFSNGIYQENQDIDMIYSNNIAYLSKNDAKLRQYIDYKNKINVNILSSDGKLYKNTTRLNKLDEGTYIKDTTERIMNFDCKLVVFNSFSNRIEVWYTDEAPAKGSPYKSYLPVKYSLVMKIVINGNRMIIADTAIILKDQILPSYPLNEAQELSESEFEEMKIKSRYTTLSVFSNERINFDTSLPKIDEVNTINNISYHLSNGGIILKKVKLPELAKQGAYCYAKATVKSDGDAYDRTGSVFIIPTTIKNQAMLTALFKGTEVLPIFTDKQNNNYQGMIAKGEFEPQIEIMRFFTSFGAGHFNNFREINAYNWSNEIVYKQDITELIPDNSEDIWIGVFIGNYDNGGHIVSLELDFYPEPDQIITTEKFILPLFNTVNILEMSGQNYGGFFRTDTLIVEFEIPINLTDAKLIYTSTGHGGWENGDEFVPKLNEIFIDNKAIYSFIPWRTDCATYRMSNPASGNFSNGLSSSDFSRSNWCPGTLTVPEYIPLNNLKPGKHIMKIVIDQGENEGDSFSHWSVSGTIVGQLENGK